MLIYATFVTVCTIVLTVLVIKLLLDVDLMRNHVCEVDYIEWDEPITSLDLTYVEAPAWFPEYLVAGSDCPIFNQLAHERSNTAADWVNWMDWAFVKHTQYQADIIAADGRLMWDLTNENQRLATQLSMANTRNDKLSKMLFTKPAITQSEIDDNVTQIFGPFED